MGTLGKIFLFVNIAVAGAAVYLASQAWAKRQEVSGVAVRNQFTLTGLEVKPPDGAGGDKTYAVAIETPSGVRIETVRKKLLDDHFAGTDGGKFSGGGTPTSQLKEVQRVQGKLNADLSAAGQDDAKLALLCGRHGQNGYTPGWLSDLAEIYDERALVREMARGANVAGDLPVATAMLEKKFKAVLEEPNPRSASADAAKLKEAAANLRKASDEAQQAGGALQNADAFLRGAQGAGVEPARQARDAAATALQGKLQELVAAQKAVKDAVADTGAAASYDDGDRRRRIATLLMLLDKDGTWQKRVALVVGLRTYSAALADHADRLKEMAASAQQLTVIDQVEFSEKYDLLKALAKQRAKFLEHQKLLNADLVDQRSQDTDAVKQRAAQLALRAADLAELQAAVAAALTRQAAVEAVVFDLQKKVGATLDDNADLEKKLDAAEQKGR